MNRRFRFLINGGRPTTQRIRAAGLAIAAAFVLTTACGKTVVFSGNDLAPESRGTLLTASTIKISEIDGVATDGSHIELAPGQYRVAFSARLRLKRVQPALSGATQRLSCEFPIEIESGEEVKLFARWHVGRPKQKGSLEQRTFHPEIGLNRSGSNAQELFQHVFCESVLDCRFVDPERVRSKGCDIW